MQISRSKWDSFIKCPRCFYILEKHQIKPPGTPGHPINSRVDALLKLILDVYFIPYNMLRFFRYLRMVHEYKKNQVEIMVLSKELKENNKKEEL